MTARSAMTHGKRRLDAVLILGVVALSLLPWYRIEDGFFGFGWLAGFPFTAETAPGLVQIATHGRLWLAVVVLLMLAAGAARGMVGPMRRGAAMAWLGGIGRAILCPAGLTMLTGRRILLCR